MTTHEASSYCTSTGQQTYGQVTFRFVKKEMEYATQFSAVKSLIKFGNKLFKLFYYFILLIATHGWDI
jgi:hypothetical protein